MRAWLAELEDRVARVAVVRRLDRLAHGNFGDHRPVGEGVVELKIDLGPGYRVYSARPKQVIVVLLCAGSKQRQRQDIERAKRYWKDYQDRDEQPALE